MNYSGARVLVTGGMGLIGSTVARRLLDRGAAVTIVDNLESKFGGNRFNLDGIESRLDIRIGDVRDRALMAELIAGQDYLFNLAGQTSHADSMTDPDTDLAINTVAQLGILEICRRSNPGIRIVFTSTRQIYGKPDYLPVDERHPIRPVDVNGINKLAGEQYHLLYHQVYGIRSSVLRLTNTYGPGMRIKDARQMFVGVWIRQLLEGKPISIFGDGTQRRDFNHVDDCVDALLRVGSCDPAAGQIFNLGAAETLSLSELADLMVAVRGKGSVQRLPFPPERKAIDIGDYQGDFGRLTAIVGWSPRVPLRQGLERTIDYYSRNLDRYLA